MRLSLSLDSYRHLSCLHQGFGRELLAFLLWGLCSCGSGQSKERFDPYPTRAGGAHSWNLDSLRPP